MGFACPSNVFAHEFKRIFNTTRFDYLYTDSCGFPTHNFKGLINEAYPKMSSELIQIFHRNSTNPYIYNSYRLLRRMEKDYEKKVKQKILWGK